MFQIKTFKHRNPERLDDAVNEFLKKVNECVGIIPQFEVAVSGGILEPFFVVTIIYKGDIDGE